MVTVDAELHIDASPDEVTRVMLDPLKARQWTAGLERIEAVSGEPGEVGAVGRLHYNEGGRRSVLTERCEHAERGKHYVSTVEGDALLARVETRLEPDDDGTLVRIRWSGRGKGVVRLLLPLMKRAI